MDVSEGEPPIKKAHHKLRIVAPDRFEACGLTLSLWYELILQRLFLLDLIAVKRTCRAFATLKRLRHRIKLKEETAFGGVERVYWNQFHTFGDTFLFGFASEHIEKLFFVCGENYRSRSYLYVAPDKRTLWNMIRETELYGHLKRSISWKLEQKKYGCMITHDGVSKYIYVQGLNKEMVKWEQLVKAKHM